MAMLPNRRELIQVSQPSACRYRADDVSSLRIFREKRESDIGRSAGSGAQGRDRTTDTMIFSHVLYQLSYLGVAAAAVL